MQPHELKKFEDRARQNGLNRFAHTRSEYGVPTPEDQWEVIPDHIDQVAPRSERFASVLGLGKAGNILGRMHDLGKFDPKFYARIKGLSTESFDHAAVGGRLSDVPSSGYFTQIILGHHRGVPDSQEDLV